METQSGEITQALLALDSGDRVAFDRLWALLYGELHRLAHFERLRIGAGETLNTTALVNEAYLRLLDHSRISARQRNQFLALVCTVMRRLLIDQARRIQAAKRWGFQERVPLEETHLVSNLEQAEALLALEEGLEHLEEYKPRLARVIELSYFGGFSSAEIAEMLDTSARTIARDLRVARTFLEHHSRGEL